MATELTGNQSALESASYFSQPRAEMRPFVPASVECILDIGSGDGGFIAGLKKERSIKELWAIEYNKEAGVRAKNVFNHVLIGDVESQLASLPRNHFDAVICNDILEHLVEPGEVIKQLTIHLTETGVLIASIPNVRYLPNLLNLFLKKDWKYEDSGILDRTHLRFFTQKSIVRMVEESGYRVEKIEGINPIKSWKFTLLNALSFGLLSDTRYMQFAIVAKANH